MGGKFWLSHLFTELVDDLKSEEQLRLKMRRLLIGSSLGFLNRNMEREKKVKRWGSWFHGCTFTLCFLALGYGRPKIYF